ncbi:myosin regulatory light chain RLC-A-like isoform X2 [Vespa velutina]|uniref:myosin regulatory light chain RLC-A-like isoform X2 n=1 Tax=Vespa velutina TaxID=202808 RepID=UPI001FB43E21|nr:myosin regulatory light chain RLC-A-like isoform X2 [Vespa velutina]
MPYPEKEENNKENQEKKVKKKKSSKIAEGQLKESVKESIEEKKKETEKKNEMDKKKEEEREKEKSDVETIKAKNLQDNVSVEKSMIFNAVSLPKEIKIRNEAFQLFDFNCDGIIDLEDLKFTFITMGKPDVSEEQLQRMLSEIPTPIDFDAFITLFGQKVSEMDSEEVITAALSTWDMRNIGMIPENKIRDDLQKFGDKFTIKEVDRALEEAPIYLQDGNAMIDYIKFSNNICGFQNLAKARQYQKNLENP